MLTLSSQVKARAMSGWTAAFLAIGICGPATATVLGADRDQRPVTFNKNFEGGSLGKIEKLAETRFKCYVEGQHDERGRNRQANWYYFRMDQVKDRDVTLTLTDVVGEYNDQPGACPMSDDIIPVFSYDNVNWEHFPSMTWDDQKKEATLQFRPREDSIWIAHVPPYTTDRLRRLLKELGASQHARVEVIGKTVQRRDLHLVTVTNFQAPDEGKKTVWLIARQHAWETGTSFVMEGALRFVTSNEPDAARLRDRVVFQFVPMMDPDGCANGKVRFNANGYDVNRHWDEVDLRRKEFLERMPEIWYVKKAIYGCVDSGRRINLLLNLHNTESAEYLETESDDELSQRLLQNLSLMLKSRSAFDPSREPTRSRAPGNSTNSLYYEKKIPVILMEQRIGFSKKLGHRLMIPDRVAFGRILASVLSEAVLREP